MLKLVAPDVRVILRKCHAPATWGNEELCTLLRYFFDPESVNALTMRKTWARHMETHMSAKDRRRWVNARVLNALRFAKMFAEAQEELIDALPRIQKCLQRFYRNPKLVVAMHQALGHELFPKTAMRFWEDKKPPQDKTPPQDKAATIAKNPKWRQCYGVSVTPKTVEHARAYLRNRVSPKLSLK